MNEDNTYIQSISSEEELANWLIQHGYQPDSLHQVQPDSVTVKKAFSQFQWNDIPLLKEFNI